jgi:glycosyltransferase involved in cell wall biosynthesis
VNILLLTQIVPYPPDAGPKIKTWHVLSYLVEHGHQVTLVTFMRKEEEQNVESLRKVCNAVFTVPIRRSRQSDVFYWLRSHITGRPFLIERDDSNKMKKLVNQLLLTESIDVIHADQLTMAQFALLSRRYIVNAYPLSIPRKENEYLDGAQHNLSSIRPTLIFDAHNAVWTIMERMRQNTPGFLKPVIALEAWRVKRYEGRITSTFDHTLAVTEVDRLALQEAAHFDKKGNSVSIPPIKVIPIVVDTELLRPVKRSSGSCNIMTLGTLHYPPNADGIRWFIQEVFPLVRQQIPDATLTVVGKNPPHDLLQLASQAPQSITFTGYVPDLTPYFEQAALMVVPVRSGGGMRVRILEGFARAMPVVTTTIGLEGIDARPNQDVWVQDTADGFAQAVVKLIKDEDRQAELGINGRRLVERKYDWKVALEELGSLYKMIEIERSEIELDFKI